MESTGIIGIVTSGVITMAGLFFQESMKEIIKKFFATKTKKKTNRLYWAILITAIILPLILFVFKSNYTNKTGTEINHPVNKIKPIPTK